MRVTKTSQKAAELMIEATEPDLRAAAPPRFGKARVGVPTNFYTARLTAVYGGPNEIQHDIISKAVLGLPS